jgi:hypothetical protein
VHLERTGPHDVGDVGVVPVVLVAVALVPVAPVVIGLEPHDVGAEVGEQLGRVGQAHPAGQFHDPYIGESPHGDSS